MKEKYSINEQIDHFKKKNIKFIEMNELDARQYLSDSSYFFRIKSYAESFEYNNNKHQYINVDFAYLVELERLDCELRRFILDVSLDIEYSLKVLLINKLTNNVKEDGYKIVNSLLLNYPYINQNILNKMNNSTVSDLIRKYHPDWAVWNIVEVLTFGEFLKLFELYFDTYPNKYIKSIRNLIWSVKFLRNAAAHYSCLLNTLRIPYLYTNSKVRKIIPTTEVSAYVSKISTIGNQTRKKKLNIPIIHNFIATLILFDEVCKDPYKRKKHLDTLYQLIYVTFSRNSDYFKNEQAITSAYEFIKKVVDYFYLNAL